MVVSQQMLVGTRANERFDLIASSFTRKTLKCKSFVAFVGCVCMCQRKKITGATAMQIKWNVSLINPKVLSSTCSKHLNYASFQTSTEALEGSTQYAKADLLVKEKQ